MVSTITFYGNLLKLPLIYLDQICIIFDHNDLLQCRSFHILPAKSLLLHTLCLIFFFMISTWQLWVHAWTEPPILYLTTLKRLVTKSVSTAPFTSNELQQGHKKFTSIIPLYFSSQYKHYNYIVVNIIKHTPLFYIQKSFANEEARVGNGTQHIKPPINFLELKGLSYSGT